MADCPVIGNEASVGVALKETTVPRSEIFLTTKLELAEPSHCHSRH